MSNVTPTAQFEPELLPGEQLLWAGRPEKSKLFTTADLFLIPLSLWGTWFAFGHLSRIIQEIEQESCSAIGGALGLAVAGIMIGLALFLLVGRIWLKFRVKSQTYYAITDKRALALVTGSVSNLQSRLLEPSDNLSKSERRGGDGTLTIGDRGPMDKIIGNTGIDLLVGDDYTNALLFYDVPQVGEVYRIVRNQTELRA